MPRLPQRLVYAAFPVLETRHREQRVGETIQVRHHLVADVLLAGQRDDTPLRPGPRFKPDGVTESGLPL